MSSMAIFGHPKYTQCSPFMEKAPILVIHVFTKLSLILDGTHIHKQGNQRWQISRPDKCQCLATFTPLNIFKR